MVDEYSDEEEFNNLPYFPESIHLDQEVHFVICISPNEAEELLTQESKMVLVIRHNCVCFEEYPRKPVHLLILGDDDGIRKKDVIDTMVNSGYTPLCHHKYLEAISVTGNQEIEIFMDS